MQYFLTWALAFGLLLLMTVPIFIVAKRTGLIAQVVVATGLFLMSAVAMKLLFGPLSGDEVAYQLEALKILDSWRTGEPFVPGQPWTKLSISYFLAVAYFLTTPASLIGVVFLTPFFIAIPLLIGRSTYNFFGSNESQGIAAWLSVLLPQVLIWSPWIRREVLSFFLLALGIYSASLMYKSRIFSSSLIMLMAIISMVLVRNQLIWLLIILFVASSAFCMSQFLRDPKKLASLGIAFTAVCATFAFALTLTASEGNVIDADTSIVASSENRAFLTGSNAAASENLAYSNEPDNASEPPDNASEPPDNASQIFSALKVTAENLLPSLFGPFPWQWKNMAWIIVGLDGLMMLLIFLIAVLPLLQKGSGSRSPAAILWVATIPLIAANALALANFGLAMRVRSHIVILLIPLVAVGFTALRSRFVARKEVEDSLLRE